MSMGIFDRFYHLFYPFIVKDFLLKIPIGVSFGYP